VPRVAWCAQAGAVAHLLVDALADQLDVTGADGHHLQRVRRLHTGELVTAADGTGRWRRYAVADATPGALALAADGAALLEPQLTPALVLACAPTKGERPEAVVRHATELGVDAIWWVTSARSVVRWDGARAAAALERLRRVAREATLQCRRARLPAVEAPGRLVDLAGRPGLLVADRDGARPAELADPPDGGWILVVGPEGGISPEELLILGDPPRLGLGPHVLRAETAALAGPAALAGRRGVPPTPPDHPG
jgi:16S rRNA (uracil1498-N3)-methyltransferase